jgi:hypothetical protein
MTFMQALLFDLQVSYTPGKHRVFRRHVSRGNYVHKFSIKTVSYVPDRIRDVATSVTVKNSQK